MVPSLGGHVNVINSRVWSSLSVVLALVSAQACGGRTVVVSDPGANTGNATVVDPNNGTVTGQPTPISGTPSSGGTGLTINSTTANFGVHALAAGFANDPYAVRVRSGGSIQAASTQAGAACTGFVTSTPDLVLNFTGTSQMLRFFVRNTDGDTTLIINDGAGRWHCNDDFAAHDPQVDIQNAPAGHYDIWVGSYRQGEQSNGELVITERANLSLGVAPGGQTGQPTAIGQPTPTGQPTVAPTGAGALQLNSTTPNFGSANLTAGFAADPHQVTVASGGSINAATTQAGSACSGFVSARPDFVLNWTGQSSQLRFFVRAQGDTTLVINDGAGRWHCNDDFAGNNPLVDIANAPAGHYDIWVGSYRSGETIRGTLFVTERPNLTP